MLKKPMFLFNQLCTPAKIYLVLSLVSVISMFYQNYKDPKNIAWVCIWQLQTVIIKFIF